MKRAHRLAIYPYNYVPITIGKALEAGTAPAG
jgi:hypothetical protein